MIVYGSGDRYAGCLDITAHEYAHLVNSVSCGLILLNYSGAVAESYADIMGNLIQNIKNGLNEWEIGELLDGGTVRDMEKPRRHDQPDSVGGRYMQDSCSLMHDHKECGWGGIYVNSGVLNKAAYLMGSNGFSDKTVLAKLFTNAMDHTVPTVDFKMFRAALLHTAREMGIDSSLVSVIDESLAQVGIVNDTSLRYGASKGTISGKAANAITKQPINGVAVKAEISGTNEEAGTATGDENGSFTLRLAENNYRITVSAAGYRSCLINNVGVTANEATYLENTVLLTEVSGNPVSYAGGIITDAVAGEPVADAEVRFRNEWGNNYGEYIKNITNSDICVFTDALGRFYTDELEYGYYTAEVKKQGFATQYVNIIAAPDADVATAQNVVLSPEASGNDFRVTLEWGATPQDLDAHIKGVTADGQSFHVYYSDKTANLGGDTVATLDHDDLSGNGFETITFSADMSGSYIYFVHRFSNDDAITASNAKVKVYQGGVMIKQFNVPVDQGEGEYWNVFSIENGEVIASNEITDSIPEIY